MGLAQTLLDLFFNPRDDEHHEVTIEETTLECCTLKNGKEYFVCAELFKDGFRYVYLVNQNEPEDCTLCKIDLSKVDKEGESVWIQSLDDEKEYHDILSEMFDHKPLAAILSKRDLNERGS